MQASLTGAMQADSEHKYQLHLRGSATLDGGMVSAKDALPELLACVMQTVMRYKENVGTHAQLSFSDWKHDAEYNISQKYDCLFHVQRSRRVTLFCR